MKMKNHYETDPLDDHRVDRRTGQPAELSNESVDERTDKGKGKEGRDTGRQIGRRVAEETDQSTPNLFICFNVGEREWWVNQWLINCECDESSDC